MINHLLTSLIGLGGGILGSMFGFSGAFIIVPLLLLFGICSTQLQAQGSTLCMLLPPISIFAVYIYYKNGHINFMVSGILILFYIIGTIIGSNIAISIDDKASRFYFGIVMLILALYSFYSSFTTPKKK